MTALSPGLVRDVAEDFLLLARSIADAESSEWLAAPKPKPAEQVTRSIGEHADPTGSTATNEHRLALRARADEARTALHEARTRLRAAREALDREFVRYHGETW